MTLNNIKTMKNRERGFTIVELLIVIVIIGILAALVIVAYSGITSRAKKQAAQASASAVQKKIEAYAADQSGTYPAFADASVLVAALDGVEVSKITSAGLSIGATAAVTDTTGQKTVAIESCTAGGTGYRVLYWDYAAATPALTNDSNKYSGNLSGTCTTWTAATA